MSRVVEWREATWFNPPVTDHVNDDGHLVVTAVEGSDLWRKTSYGMVKDTGHGLLVNLEDKMAVEVGFVMDYTEQFDQAGVLIRIDENNWIKAGVEVSDGSAQVGAVVTRDVSDWSVAPVPDWAGREVVVRASCLGDACTIRARVGEEPWRLVRLAPLPVSRQLIRAGPYCCAPTRAGLEVRFTRFAITPADASLHP